MSSVTLEKLTKSYAGKKGALTTVVNAIDLEIHDREFMVIVGPSGCGKSTTLRMIAGLEQITGGFIRIGGRVVNDLAPKERDIAMVFQNYALYPQMTVRENMAFGLKMRNFAKEEISLRVEEASRMLGLGQLLDRLPKDLSGGQRQRVAVGRAIVRQPAVFLFDEPLSNLDAKMRASTRSEISQLHSRLGATMIYVTHDQVEAMTMGDRICVMKDGNIMQVDEPLNLYNKPANLFVAGFIGSPPMNFLKGTIRGDGDEVLFVEAGGSAAPVVLSLRGELGRAARASAGRGVMLGVRPEDLHESVASETGMSAEVSVELVEPMGAETYLHLSTGASRFVARVPSTTRRVSGETMTIGFDCEKLHIFDESSENALRGAQP